MAKQPNLQQFQWCYQNWESQERLDLDEMVQALAHHPADLDYLCLITRKIVNHFEDYTTTRAQLAKNDGPCFIAPAWGTTFENSFLWIGGCRPSLVVRLLYALCGSETEAHLAEFLQGVRRGNLGELSSHQLKHVDVLRAKTVKDEDKLGAHMASLQEGVADEPLLLLAKSSRSEESSQQDVEKAMDAHALKLSALVVEADKLRLSVLKDIIDILTPLQAVELLVASKKLHLSLHEWSRRRDLKMGIPSHLFGNKPSCSHGPPPD